MSPRLRAELVDAELRPLIADVLERAERTIRPERIWLFGSRARGTNQPHADVDLAFSCMNAGEERWSEFVADVEEGAPTLLALDLVNMRTCQESLRQEILREGRLLYERRAS
jgi:predicted nucleotidyltransferase